MGGGGSLLFWKFSTASVGNRKALVASFLKGSLTFARKLEYVSLIRSISGFRGTIGGSAQEGLTPPVIVEAVSAFASILFDNNEVSGKGKVVIGRDARVSGSMVKDLVVGTLRGSGLDVLDLGISTTPTVEISVVMEEAIGGIVLTASHNPSEWNALKFLDSSGEFIPASTGEKLIARADSGRFTYAASDALGVLEETDRTEEHIQRILASEFVNLEPVKNAGLKVVVDGVNSSGGVVLPQLLKAMGIDRIICINCEPTGHFAHDAEPLPEHLEDLSDTVLAEGAHLGIAVDPDVDRLAFVDENGEVFGEEYTLVAVADHVLDHRPGNAVSNLSSSRALKDVTQWHGGTHYASAVGEVNVVERMKEVGAVIGGEGNGGVILPELHYGRDALVGVALFLTHLALRNETCSVLRSRYPDYFMAKEKLRLEHGDDPDLLLDKISRSYEAHPQNKEDGVKIEFDREWVHLRRSNTEPILRVYTESISAQKAQELAGSFVNELKEVLEKSRSIQNS